MSIEEVINEFDRLRMRCDVVEEKEQMVTLVEEDAEPARKYDSNRDELVNEDEEVCLPDVERGFNPYGPEVEIKGGGSPRAISVDLVEEKERDQVSTSNITAVGTDEDVTTSFQHRHIQSHMLILKSLKMKMS
ncbi:hypothetical protein Tco_1114699 [Tanacetum coccineum]|uniref:Uncharacterized protein n=1 Tax=Tanacetum coccineum TaxID=301880 RepID=A0ABQ5IVV1_9ASTR